MEDLVKAELFNRIVTKLFENDTENIATLVVSYIKSVSLVPSATESDIEHHLQTENILFCESFALDHQNYPHSHYGAFQHVNLQSLRKENEERFNEL